MWFGDPDSAEAKDHQTVILASRSPDLSMCNLFLKANMYKEKPHSLEKFQAAIRNKTALINEKINEQTRRKLLKKD